MEHSEFKKARIKKDTALWGGAPQYDYIHYDNCTNYGIPSEAAYETGGTGDDMHYQEKALNHIQVPSFLVEYHLEDRHHDPHALSPTELRPVGPLRSMLWSRSGNNLIEDSQ